MSNSLRKQALINRISAIKSQHEENLLRLEVIQEDYAAVIDELSELPQVEISAALGCDTLDLRVVGNGFDLTQVWKILRSANLKPSSRPAAQSTYFIAFWEDPNKRLVFWMSFSSTHCRKVSTGRTITKVVEEPEYTITCGEGDIKPETLT